MYIHYIFVSISSCIEPFLNNNMINSGLCFINEKGPFKTGNTGKLRHNVS